MLLAKGDAAGAAAKFDAAHRASPRFADALKGWGDALALQGQSQAAFRKYDEALKYAPNWTALKEAREAGAKPKS
jgi:tetratricopeptide (TPR) repeat protein